MQHLIISIGILALAMGVSSLMYVQRLTLSYQFPYLRIYFKYLVVLNISVLLNLSTHYLLTNVLASLEIRRRLLLVIWVNIIGFFFFALLNFFYLQLTRRLVNKSLGAKLRELIFLIAVVAALAYGFSAALYASSSDISPFLLVHRVCICILSLVSLFASLRLFKEAGSEAKKSRARPLRWFGAVGALFYAYQILLVFFPFRAWIVLSACNLLVLNVIPIPFLSSLLRDSRSETSNRPEVREKIEKFYEANGLSKREMEIAALLLQGKSNEEIEAELFISLFTVKKHVSNIFDKLDVHSRAQFSHLVMRAALTEEYLGSEETKKDRSDKVV